MKPFLRPLSVALLAFCLAAQPSYGEVGNDNPTGVTGNYNGSITTAGSYDPYTGNGKRFITDLTVTGSIGAYPLKWTRVNNTRGGQGGAFGHGGGWRHSYQWGIWVRSPQDYQYHDNQYEGPAGMVSYPDGRTMVLYDWYSTLPQTGGEPGDLLIEAGDGNYDLVMADGGRVKFRHPAGSTSGYDLVATEIVDPFGQATRLVRDSENRLSTITEPGGRYLQINYRSYFYNVTYPRAETRRVDVIDNVQAFAGPGGQLIETVSYRYQPEHVRELWYYNLQYVDYADATQAFYEYLPSDSYTMVSGRLWKCHDVRYAGAMSEIEYQYATARDMSETVAEGQIKAEKRPGTSIPVSEVIYPPGPFNNTNGGTQADPRQFLRTEKRADGRTRTFQYSSDGGGELKTYTDFKDQLPVKNTTQIDFFWVDSFTYGKRVTDARGKATTFVKDGAVGAVLSATYHDGATVRYGYSEQTNKYYLTSREDERGKKTVYTRYDISHPNRHMIERINYPDDDNPDASWESFIYNRFNQVLDHRMTNGATEKFTYDERGLKQTYTPPATESDPNPRPTEYFYYESGIHTDRLKQVRDPRQNSTWYEYNARGQVTKVTHQDGTFTQSFYNPDGTLAWSADENHPDAGQAGHEQERTRYQYDDYKRVISVTKAFEMPATNSYDPPNGQGPLSHTTSSVYLATSPASRQIEHDYDENFRRQRTTVAPGTNDAATTTFTYDPVGNLETVTEPNHQSDGGHTRYDYDDRNRQTIVTDALGNKTTTAYDDAGNKTSVERADGYRIQFIKYDAMNRLEEQIDERNYLSSNTYDAAGNLKAHTDERQKVYSYEYDELNRKKRMTYPPTYPPDGDGNQRFEHWTYDEAGNLKTFTNRSGAVQTFHYDDRNRAWRFEWSDGTSWQETDYDDASRVEEIRTGAAHTATVETTIQQTYHDDNRLWTETVWASASIFGGSPARTVRYTYDPDGNRETVQYQGGEIFTYHYTPRNQLWTIKLGQGPAIVTYEYDPSGNMKKVVRDNRTETQLAPDEVNRVRHIVHYFDSGGARSFEYAYNKVNNVTAVRRDWGHGDGFEYDQSRQITGFNRDGTFAAWPPPPAGNPANNPVNSMAIGFDAGGNRTTVTNSNTALANISYVPNDLNQYVMVSESGGAAPTPTPPPASPTPPPATPTPPPVTPTPTPPVPTPTVPPVSPTPTPTPLPQVAEPTFDPETRSYPSGNTQMIKMTSAGATIYYTTNGDDPSLSGQQIASGGSVPVSPTYDGTPLRAIARKAGMADSNIHEATYFNINDSPPPSSPTPTAPPQASPTPTVPPVASPTPTAPPASPIPTSTPPPQVAEPTFNPDGGLYFRDQEREVTVQTTTAGCNMRYNFGASPPTRDTGTLIASSHGTISVRPTLEGRTLNVIAFREGMSDSEVHSATYTYEYDPSNEVAPRAPVPGVPGVVAPVAKVATSANTSSAPRYDLNGNLTHYKGWVYTYDAQNRLRTARHNGTLIATYYYDGKNRQIARSINNVIRFSVWDGWELIEEYGSGRATAYLQGATGVIKSWGNDGTYYYYQDKLGSTTHTADGSGALVESFHYDLYGKPDQSSAHGVVDLYAGERWVGELGLYDLRNRFMSSELGRFLQADPIGFKGDASNLYRYCHNDPENFTDPMGLDTDIYLDRDYADRRAPGTYYIKDNGKEIYRGRANENPFYPGTLSKGISAGSYVLKPKGLDWGPIRKGEFPAAQPAITGRAAGLKAGQPNSSYKAPALVHLKGAPGHPDSRACVTVDARGVQATTEVMERNIKDGETTRFHISEPNEEQPPTRRAELPGPGRPGGNGGLGGSDSGSGGSGRRSFDAYGSPTAHAAIWEEGWGAGGWLATQRL